MPRKYDNALVSAIVPAYRRVTTLPVAVRSILDQTYGNLELIVVDDGSGDSTPDVAEAIAQTDARMQVIRLSQNSGVCHARNVALEAARGRYIAFLDSDDCWLPTKLERQINFLSSSEACLSFTGFRRTRHDKINAGNQIRVPAFIDYKTLCKTNVIATSTTMVDREVSGDFRMSKAKHDDYATWLKLLRNDNFAIGIDEVLMHYGVSDDSLSKNKLKSAINTWNVYRQNEGMGILSASRAFANYAVEGLSKHVRTRV